MSDDAGSSRLLVALDEPTRLDVDLWPLHVYVRVESVVVRALGELHDQALQLDEVSPRG